MIVKQSYCFYLDAKNDFSSCCIFSSFLANFLSATCRSTLRILFSLVTFWYIWWIYSRFFSRFWAFCLNLRSSRDIECSNCLYASFTSSSCNSSLMTLSILLWRSFSYYSRSTLNSRLWASSSCFTMRSVISFRSGYSFSSSLLNVLFKSAISSL